MRQDTTRQRRRYETLRSAAERLAVNLCKAWDGKTVPPSIPNRIKRIQEITDPDRDLLLLPVSAFLGLLARCACTSSDRRDLTTVGHAELGQDVADVERGRPQPHPLWGASVAGSPASTRTIAWQ
jgi:hypothetical protein